MSSAKNHRIRSHRSYKNKVSTAEQFQRKTVVNLSLAKVMKGQSNFFAKLFGMLKKGDK